jgi:hypothetical protein
MNLPVCPDLTTYFTTVSVANAPAMWPERRKRSEVR